MCLIILLSSAGILSLPFDMTQFWTSWSQVTEVGLSALWKHFCIPKIDKKLISSTRQQILYSLPRFCCKISRLSLCWQWVILPISCCLFSFIPPSSPHIPLILIPYLARLCDTFICRSIHTRRQARPQAWLCELSIYCRGETTIGWRWRKEVSHDVITILSSPMPLTIQTLHAIDESSSVSFGKDRWVL